MADKNRLDLVVVGSGPGGYVAAVHAARLGLKVACVEKNPRLGGVCLNVGCIPSKALLDSSEFYHLAKDKLGAHGVQTGRVGLDLAAMMARKDKVVGELTESVQKLLENHKVRIVAGEARLSGPDQVTVAPAGGGKSQTLSAGAILLATGSEPVAVPGLDFDGERVVSSTEALAFDAVPKHLVIVGGGYIGLELGSVWQRLGAKVTVIEMLPQIAAGLDGQIGRKLKQVLTRQGFTFRLETRVSAARVKGKTVQVSLEAGDRTETLSCDRLLVAVGRRPLTRGLGLEDAGVETDPKTGRVLVDAAYRTNVSSVYAIGDLVAGPMLAHKASAEGMAAAEIIAGGTAEVNYDAIPSIVYTWPEVAAVGLTQEQVKERGIPHRIGTYPFAGSGRARCMGETEGMVKLIAHEKTDRILGVHIIGPRASDMIAEAVLALEMGAAAEDLARTVHGHPTFAEALMEAALAVQK
jgi:dihydrolipoamide dehydrogenase